MYNKKVHVYFVGIAAIGISDIAKVFKTQKYIIFGYAIDLQQQSG